MQMLQGASDLKKEFVVGPHGEKFPTVRLVLGQIVVDHHRLRRVVEVFLDLLDLRNLGKFGDVERAVVEGQSIRSIETGCDDLDLAFAALVDDSVHLVLEAAADKHRALIADPHGTCIVNAAGVELDLEASRQGQLVGGKLVSRGRDRRRRDRREFHRAALLGRPALGPWRRSVGRGRGRLLGCERPSN